MLRQWLAEGDAPYGVAERLVERAAREPQGRGADGGAEDVERRQRHLEALARLPHQGAGRHAAALEHEGAQRVGREHVDAFGDPQPRVVGLHEEGAESPLAGFGESAEDDVEISEAGVGDPGLGAVEHPIVPILPGRRPHGGDVRAGRLLREGEGGDRLAGRDSGKPGAPLLLGAEQR